MHKSLPMRAFAHRALSARTQVGLLGAGVLVVAALFIGLPLLAHAFAPAPPPPAPRTPGSFVTTRQQWATLSFAPVALHDFRSEAEADGRIVANDDRTTQVFSPFSGRVTRVFVRAGAQVRAGEPLFAVSASEFSQAQADLATASAQAKLARAVEARERELVKVNGAPQKDWLQSQADLAAAEASLRSVLNRLRIMGLGEHDLAAVERGGTLRASPETVVASPISGVATQRNVGPGQNIASVSNGGTSPAFVVSDVSSVWLEGDLPDDQGVQARVGQQAEVRTAALPGRIFKATVDYVSPTVDPDTHRVPVRATIANPDRLLKPQMFASFRLYTDGATTAVGAPEEGVIFEGDAARVWVAHPGRALELRQIRTGRVSDGLVEVVAGLSPGERIVTGGSLFIDRAAQGDGQ